MKQPDELAFVGGLVLIFTKYFGGGMLKFTWAWARMDESRREEGRRNHSCRQRHAHAQSEFERGTRIHKA